MRFYDDMKVGDRSEIGAFTFTAAEIKRFAGEFDPQAFHLEEVAVWGPSPGFRDLRWIRPVLAGDTVSFASELVSRRISTSRPGWGIVEARNSGTNQRGEEVFSILAMAFVPRR